jgi:DNA-directed RNA polymerase
MIRIESSHEQVSAVKHADLGRTFSVLDMLSSTSWKINKKVLNIA